MAGNALSHVGTWVQRVAVGWLAWELTGSGTWLGIIALADLAPVVLIGPVGGALTDRLSPLRITLVCQVISLMLSTALCLLTWWGVMTAPLLALLVLGQGLAMGFAQPARQTLIYVLVPRAHLPTGVAINAVVFNMARFIGPAIAGAILVWSGPALAFGINSASFLAFIIALLGVKLAPEPREPAAEGESLFAEIAAGVRYARHHTIIGPLIVFTALLSILARPYLELLPGFADAVLGGGAPELALLTSSTALGAIVSGIWLAGRGGQFSTFRFVVTCGLVTAGAILGFAASQSLMLSVLCVVIAGGALVMAGITAQTLVQLHVDPDFRGRTLSLYGMLFRSGPATGALFMGVASEWVGLQWPVAAGALIVIGLSLWFWPRTGTMTRPPRS